MEDGDDQRDCNSTLSKEELMQLLKETADDSTSSNTKSGGAVTMRKGRKVKSLTDFVNGEYYGEKDALIRSLAKKVLPALKVVGQNGKSINIDTVPIDKLVEFFRNAFSMAMKRWGVKSPEYRNAVNMIGDAINQSGNVAIDSTLSLGNKFKKIAEYLGALLSTQIVDFAGTVADVDRVFNNLQIVRDALDASHNKQLEIIERLADPIAIQQSSQVEELFKLLKTEYNRQIEMLAHLLGKTLRPATQDILSALEGTPDMAGFISDLRSANLPEDKFGEGLSTMLSGVSANAYTAKIVRDALQALKIRVSDYVKASSPDALRRLLHNGLVDSRHTPREMLDMMTAAQKILDLSLQHDKIAPLLQTVKGGCDCMVGGEYGDREEEDFIGGDIDISGAIRLEQQTVLPPYWEQKNLKNQIARQSKLREGFLKSFRSFLKGSFTDIVKAARLVQQRFGKEIPINDATKNFVQQFTRLPNVNRENMHKILSGYYQAATVKNDRDVFLSQYKQMLAVIDSTGVKDSAFTMLRSAIEKMLGEINNFGENIVSQMIGLDFKTVEEQDNSLRRIFGSSEDVANDIFANDAVVTFQALQTEMRYTIHIADIKTNISRNVLARQDYSAEYVNILGEEAGYMINKMREQENANTAAFNTIVDNDNQTWTPAALAFNDAIQLERRTKVKELRAAHMNKELDARIAMVELAQNIDLVMKSFTESLCKNPDQIKAMMDTLYEIDFISKFYTDRAGNLLAQLFECFGKPAYELIPFDEIIQNNKLKEIPIDKHYYRLVADKLAAISAGNLNPRPIEIVGSPLNEHTLPDATADLVTKSYLQVSQIMTLAEQAVKQVHSIVNILNMFEKISKDGKMNSGSSFMNMGQVMGVLLNYIKYSSFTVTFDPARPAYGTGAINNVGYVNVNIPATHGPGGPANYNVATASRIDNLAPVDARQYHDGLYLMCIPNYNAAANYFAYHDIASYTLNNRADITGNPDKFFNTDLLFHMTLKAIVAKILVMVEAFRLFHRPMELATANANALNPTRVILGGNSVKIVPECVELYLRLPLLAEWYREKFSFKHHAEEGVAFKSSEADVETLATSITTLVTAATEAAGTPQDQVKADASAEAAADTAFEFAKIAAIIANKESTDNPTDLRKAGASIVATALRDAAVVNKYPENADALAAASNSITRVNNLYLAAEAVRNIGNAADSRAAATRLAGVTSDAISVVNDGISNIEFAKSIAAQNAIAATNTDGNGNKFAAPNRALQLSYNLAELSAKNVEVLNNAKINRVAKAAVLAAKTSVLVLANDAAVAGAPATAAAVKNAIDAAAGNNILLDNSQIIAAADVAISAADTAGARAAVAALANTRALESVTSIVDALIESDATISTVQQSNLTYAKELFNTIRKFTDAVRTPSANTRDIASAALANVSRMQGARAALNGALNVGGGAALNTFIDPANANDIAQNAKPLIVTMAEEVDRFCALALPRNFAGLPEYAKKLGTALLRAATNLQAPDQVAANSAFNRVADAVKDAVANTPMALLVTAMYTATLRLAALNQGTADAAFAATAVATLDYLQKINISSHILNLADATDLAIKNALAFDANKVQAIVAKVVQFDNAVLAESTDAVTNITNYAGNAAGAGVARVAADTAFDALDLTDPATKTDLANARLAAREYTRAFLRETSLVFTNIANAAQYEVVTRNAITANTTTSTHQTDLLAAGALPVLVAVGNIPAGNINAIQNAGLVDAGEQGLVNDLIVLAVNAAITAGPADVIPAGTLSGWIRDRAALAVGAAGALQALDAADLAAANAVVPVGGPPAPARGAMITAVGAAADAAADATLAAARVREAAATAAAQQAATDALTAATDLNTNFAADKRIFNIRPVPIPNRWVLTVMPTIASIWTALVTIVFDKAFYVKDGNYSEQQVQGLIEAINDIYKTYRSRYPTATVRNILNAFVDEINRVFGFAEYDSIEAFEDEKRKFLTESVEVGEDMFDSLDVLNADNQFGRGTAPSDKFVVGDFKVKKNQVRRPMAKLFIRIRELREEIDKEFNSIMSNGQLVTFESTINTYNSQIKQAEERDKYKIVLGMMQGSSRILASDANRIIMTHEAIILPLFILQQYIGILTKYYSTVIWYSGVFIRDRRRYGVTGNIVEALRAKMSRATSAWLSLVEDAMDINNNPEPQNNRPGNRLVAERYLGLLRDLSNSGNASVSLSNEGALSVDFSELEKHMRLLVSSVRKNIEIIRSSADSNVEQYDKFEAFGNTYSIRWVEEILAILFDNRDECGLEFITNTYASPMVKAILTSKSQGQPLGNTPLTLDNNNFTMGIGLGTFLATSVLHAFHTDQVSLMQPKAFPYNNFTLGVREPGGDLLTALNSLSASDPSAAAAAAGGVAGQAAALRASVPVVATLSAYNKNSLSGSTKLADISLITGLNEILYRVVELFFDSADSKFYSKLLEDFMYKSAGIEFSEHHTVYDLLELAQGAVNLNLAITRPNPDPQLNFTFTTHAPNTQVGLRGKYYVRGSKKYATITASNVLLINELYNQNITIGSNIKKKLLWENLADVPDRVKETMKENLPHFIRMLKELRARTNYLQMLISEVNINTTLDVGDLSFINQLVEVTGGRLPLGEVDNATIQWYKTVLARIDLQTTTLINTFNTVYSSLGDSLVYYGEQYKGFFNMYREKNNTRDLPLIPVSYIAAGYNTNRPLLPDSQGTEVNRYNNSVKTLLLTDVKMDHLPTVKQIYSSYSSSIRFGQAISSREFEDLTLRCVTMLTNLVKGRSVTGEFRMANSILFTRYSPSEFYNDLPAPGGLGIAIPVQGLVPQRFNYNGNVVNNPMNGRNRDLVQIQGAVNVDQSGIFKVISLSEPFGKSLINATQRNKVVVPLYTNAHGGTATDYNKGRRALRTANIIDANIVPINVHGFMREVPFTNLINLSYTFDRTVSYYLDIVGDVALNTGIRSSDYLMAKLAIYPYAEVTASEYFDFFTAIASGADKFQMGRPKYIYDQLYNKVLFGNALPAERYKSPVGPPAYDALKGARRFIDLAVQDPMTLQAGFGANNAGSLAANMRLLLNRDGAARNLPFEVSVMHYLKDGAPKAVNMGAIETVYQLSIIGYTRFQTKIVRNIYWCVMMQRILRHILAQHVIFLESPVNRGVKLLNPKNTEFQSNEAPNRKDFTGQNFRYL